MSYRLPEGTILLVESVRLFYGYDVRVSSAWGSREKVICLPWFAPWMRISLQRFDFDRRLDHLGFPVKIT